VNEGSRRGSPLGCVVGLLSLLPLVLALTSAYGLVRWLMLPAAEREPGPPWIFLGFGGCGLLLFVALIWLSRVILRNTSWRDGRPDEPHSSL